MSYLKIKAESWHKSALCKMIGHSRTGWKGSIPYGRVRIAAVDGLGTEHGEIVVTCDRCNENVSAIRFHVPKHWKTR